MEGNKSLDWDVMFALNERAFDYYRNFVSLKIGENVQKLLLKIAFLSVSQIVKYMYKRHESKTNNTELIFTRPIEESKY